MAACVEVDFELNDKQFEFFESRSKSSAIVSGLGGGKTFALLFTFICNEVLAYPNARHCFGALSYRQLEDTSIPTMEFFLDEMRIPYDYVKGKKMFIVNGKTEVLFRAENTADRMRSVEIGSLYCEELAYWSRTNFLTFFGRLRDKNGSLRCRAATTPNGLNWFYDYAVTEGLMSIIRTSSYDNLHLPEEYLQSLEDSYDKDLQAQEIEGRFVNVGTAKAYYSFNREKCVYKFDEKDPTSVGTDFNVNPMTSVLGFVEDDKIYITNEVWLKHSNTYRLKEHLVENFGTELMVIPDATCKARKTSAVKSDHAILSEVFRVARVRNPHRKDRFNCVNGLLDHGRLIIHPRCEKLIRDLELFTDSTKDADELGHISDALGYMCWYYFPLKKSIFNKNGLTDREGPGVYSRTKQL